MQRLVTPIIELAMVLSIAAQSTKLKMARFGQRLFGRQRILQ
jgi:hypothetical protein